MPYFDTAVVVTVLILLGQVLELKARGRDQRRHQGPAQTGPQNGAARARRRTWKKTCRSNRSEPAICCASGPARKLPVDGVVVEGHSSGRRIDDLPASRCRSRKSREAKSSPPRSTERVRCWCVPSGSGPRRCWRKSCRWSARPSAAGADRADRRSRGAVFRPGSGPRQPRDVSSSGACGGPSRGWRMPW